MKKRRWKDTEKIINRYLRRAAIFTGIAGLLTIANVILMILGY